MRRALVLALLSVAAGGLAACGGSSSSDDKQASTPARTQPAKRAPAQTTPTKTTPSPAGQSAADAARRHVAPRVLLKRVGVALASAGGFRAKGRTTDDTGANTIDGQIGPTGNIDIKLATGASHAEIIVIGDRFWLNANAAYWRKSDKKKGRALGKAFDGRWVTGPASALGSSTVERYKPATIAYCVGHGSGTLSYGGGATVAGKQATIIRDRGNKPGSEPGRLYVAATGVPVPLRQVQSGPQRPGGKFNPRCDDKDDKTRTSDIRYSAFGHPAPIRKPPHAIDLQQLQQQGSGSDQIA